LAVKIANIVGYKGEMLFDISKNDGTPRKLMDCSKINQLGWKHMINIDEGLKKTIDEVINQNTL
jgi:GDP-L-fucose synthase